ncbi:hypothetical protein TRFO_24106 [Tritrichomonas foetus]|uniref:Uncharacterized protein n=1 Tax=Tritrichomonas foetus TaxID=1144522 RepID=A0A1J4K8Z1_9EUKA|nr:hypothetical protein TRFO_24106 [Tritrichomonas foetus]|eukprot:OHT07683.1 hypothetical protein TRFO_24106 [Tritrichomonas foetus]
MIFAFLLGSCFCWEEEPMIIAMEIAFRQIGDNAHTTVKKVLQMNHENLIRDSIIGAWINSIEKPPSNTYTFNHWRFTRTPINRNLPDESITMHENLDDLQAQLKEFDDSLYRSSILQPWPYTVAFKSYFGLVGDVYSPLHNAELFDERFPEGDNCGRNFFIKYNGKNISLYDFWETGCGRFTKSLPYSDDDWKEIDKLADQLREEIPYTSFKDASTSFEIIGEESKNIANQTVYSIQYNQELKDDDEYVKQCKEITTQRIVFAAYKISVQLKKFNVPSFPEKAPEQPVGSSEIVAWAAFSLLLPAFIFSVWKYLSDKIKFD